MRLTNPQKAQSNLEPCGSFFGPKLSSFRHLSNSIRDRSLIPVRFATSRSFHFAKDELNPMSFRRKPGPSLTFQLQIWSHNFPAMQPIHPSVPEQSSAESNPCKNTSRNESARVRSGSILCGV